VTALCFLSESIQLILVYLKRNESISIRAGTVAGPYNTIDQPVETKNKMALLNVPYLYMFQIVLFKDKIEQIIKLTEKVVPKMITGVNNVAFGSMKNFWGPADNKHMSPTMTEDIYPIL